VGFGQPILQALFGGFGWNGLYLFERLLLFILLIAVVYVALSRVPLFEDNERKSIRWVISIIIPLIGIRYINYEWMSAIILQYTALAVILTCILPFLIYFYFVYNMGGESGALRKIMWALFIGIYLGLYSTAELNADPTIYLWTVVVSAVCFFIDGKIYARMKAREMMKQNRNFKLREIANINDEIRKVDEQIRNRTYPDPKAVRETIKQLLKHRDWLAKQN
jgi:hypothetical protein